MDGNLSCRCYPRLMCRWARMRLHFSKQLWFLPPQQHQRHKHTFVSIWACCRCWEEQSIITHSHLFVDLDRSIVFTFIFEFLISSEMVRVYLCGPPSNSSNLTCTTIICNCGWESSGDLSSPVELECLWFVVARAYCCNVVPIHLVENCQKGFVVFIKVISKQFKSLIKQY